MIDAAQQAALAVAARQRSQMYWWLSDLLLVAPEESTIAALRERTASAVGESDDFPFKDRLREMAAGLASSSSRSLAIEHARLFAGLSESYGLPPPFESIHAAVPAHGDSTPSMVDAYRAAGFDRIDVPAVPQDHLAVELRFMALLAAQEAAARDEGADGRVAAILGQQERFLDTHLLAWVPAYCKRVANESREPFYTAVARLTAEALVLDRENLDDLTRETAARSPEP